jgi:hypothetical protein
MLHSNDVTSPAPAGVTGPQPWVHLTIPQRLARVIARVAPRMGEDRVTLEDFLHEEETCDLTPAEIGAHIGAAKRLISVGTDEPAYDRTARLAAAADTLVALLPDPATLRKSLATEGYSAAELDELWTDLVSMVARRFRASRAPAPALPDWAREQLTANAE